MSELKETPTANDNDDAESGQVSQASYDTFHDHNDMNTTLAVQSPRLPAPPTTLPTLDDELRAHERDVALSVSLGALDDAQSSSTTNWCSIDRTLFLFGPDNRLRRFCGNVVRSWWFSLLMFLLILADTCYCFSRVWDSTALITSPWEAFDVFKICVYVLYVLLYFVANGVVLLEDSFLRDFWNCFFFVILLATALVNVNLSAFHCVRILRALRSMKKLPSFNVLINSILVAPKALLPLVLVVVVSLVVCAMLTTELFGASFDKRCAEESGKLFSAEIYEDRMCGLSDWTRTCPSGSICTAFENPLFDRLHFEHVGASTLTLWAATTGSAWTRMLKWSEDSVHSLSWLFWVPFMLMINLVLSTMVFVLVVSSFAEQKEFVSEEQRIASRVTLISELISEEYEEPISCVVLLARRVSDRFNTWVSRERVPPSNCLSHAVRKLVIRNEFDYVYIAVIIFVTFLMIVDSPCSRVWWADTAYAILVLYFCADVLLRWVAIGPLLYFRDPMNAFHSLISLSGFIEIVSPWSRGDLFTHYSLLPIVFRVVRVFKLLRTWKAMQRTVRQVAGNVANIASLTILTVLFWLLLTFWARVTFDNIFPSTITRISFASMPDALVSTLQTMLSDSFTVILFSSMSVQPFWGFTFATVAVVLCRYLVRVMFVAFLLQGGDFEDEEDGELEPDEVPLPAEPPKNVIRRFFSRFSNWFFMLDTKHVDSTVSRRKSVTLSSGAIAERRHDEVQLSDGRRVPNQSATTEWRLQRLQGASFGVFSERHVVRRAVVNALRFDHFDQILAALLALFIIGLTVDLMMNGTPSQVFLVFRIVFVSFLALEMLLKSIAWGLVRNADAVLRNRQDLIECVLCVATVVAACFQHTASLHTLLSLQLLRLCVRIEASARVIHVIWLGLRATSTALAVVSIIWIVLASLGMLLFACTFGHCEARNDKVTVDVAVDRLSCVGDTVLSLNRSLVLYPFVSEETHNVTLEWFETRDANFDTFPEALLSLFRVSLLSNWGQLMRWAIDARGDGLAPMEGYANERMIYFFVLIVLGNFFGIGMFIARVIDAFDDDRRGTDPDITPFDEILNDTRTAWKRVNSHKMHRSMLSRACDVVSAVHVCLCITLQCIPSSLIDEFRSYLNISLLSLLFFELILRLAAKESKKWLLFDALMLVCGVVLEVTVGVVVIGVRLVHCVRPIYAHWKSARALLNALFKLTERLPFIFLVLFSVIYAFSALGTHLLRGGSGDGLGGQRIPYGNGIDESRNFDTFSHSLLTIFQLSTLDDAFAVVYDGMGRTCTDHSSSSTCGNAWNLVFFIAFLVFRVFVLLSAFVATTMAASVQDWVTADENLLQILTNVRNIWLKLTVDDANGEENALLFMRKVFVVLNVAMSEDCGVFLSDEERTIDSFQEKWLIALQRLQIHGDQNGNVHLDTLIDAIVAAFELRYLGANTRKLRKENIVWMHQWYAVRICERALLRWKRKQMGKKEAERKIISLLSRDTSSPLYIGEVCEGGRQVRRVNDNVLFLIDEDELEIEREEVREDGLEENEGKKRVEVEERMSRSGLKSGMRVTFEAFIVHKGKEKILMAKNVEVRRKKKKKEEKKEK